MVRGQVVSGRSRGQAVQGQAVQGQAVRRSRSPPRGGRSW